MIEISRETFKSDPIFGKLFDAVKAGHKVAKHTERTLRKNKHIKDFCEEARHFVQIGDDKPIWIHYDVASWWKDPAGVVVKIESIGVYDNFMEYDIARLKGIHSGRDSDVPNIN